ncbi:MAG: carotenoid oxygenase family protein [Polyangiales bacterium]
MTSLRRATAERWARAHRPVDREVSDEPLAVLRGSIPSALRGALFRCGPGRLEAYSTQYQHLFDGDGHVCRFAFDGQTVRFANRYVRTREFLEELAANRVLYRSFGTPKPGGLRANAFDARFKNAANTTAFVHQHKLWALWEAGLPHALDPVTLDTIARDDFAQRLLAADDTWTRIAGRDLPFSAHPRVDPRTNELFNFGLANGPTQKLLLYHADAALRMDAPEEHELDALYFVHDFSLTARFRVLFLCPARFDVLRTMTGLDTPLSGMRFDPSRPTKVWLCPRDGGAPMVLEAPSGFVFHHVNAWEEDRDTLVVHALRSDVLPELPIPRDLDANSVAPPQRERPLYCEYTIDLARRSVRVARLFDVPSELPMVHPSRVSTRHRFAWATATDPSKPMRVNTRLAKFDLDERAVSTIEFAPGFAGEPVFVPRADGGRGDDGWLLAMGYDGDAQRSALRVLDARTLEIVCVLALPFDVAPGFHGAWMSAQ